MFQFQNGSIKRAKSLFHPGAVVCFNSKMVRLKDIDKTFISSKKLFQFQNGSIKSVVQVLRLYNFCCFNSKMVRLKGWNQERKQFFLYGFNSKMVRLKESCVNTYVFQSAQFQFQNGSIKREIASSEAIAGCIVSIPKWFD